MQVYMYRAALYCEDCGESIKANFKPPLGYDPDDESSWDSDDYPKGPYGDGGGEADYAAHCDRCDAMLGNPLTDDGLRNVADAFAEGSGACLSEWAERYGAAVRQWVRFEAEANAESGRPCPDYAAHLESILARLDALQGR